LGIKFKYTNLLKVVTLSLVLFFCVYQTATAQYYYNDFIVNQQTQADLANLKEKKITNVEIASLESNGEPSKGFYCEKKINKSYTKTETLSATAATYKTLLTTVFNTEGKIISSTDSSQEYVATSIFTYNLNGTLQKVKITNKLFNDDYTNETTEERVYGYDEKLFLKTLTVTKNKNAVTNYSFAPDEKGNIAIEKNLRTGEIYYYYYNINNQLEEVVHKYANRTTFSTDFIFKYNDEKTLAQMQVAEQEGAYYFTWRYRYDNNLRTDERCYSKEGKLLGTIEYIYK
jgi:hypothetical protein